MKPLGLMLIFGLAIVGIIHCGGGGAGINKYNVIDTVLNSVVWVNSASGVVIYSDNERALVLTSYHIIKGDIIKIQCSENNYYSKIYTIEGDKKILYEIINIYGDEANDLALITIKVDKRLHYVNIYRVNVRVGDDIYTVSNPMGLYRSFKKGIISSTTRKMRNVSTTEISTGVTFGSSGGGVFTTDGRLIGIIKSVTMLNTKHCHIYTKGDLTCLVIPIEYLGFSVPREVVANFLLNSSHEKLFSYLR